MLKVRHLETGYGRKQVLFGVSLDVRPGEVVALIGPNGAGKSTLLKAVCGLLPVWAGEMSHERESIVGGTPAQNVGRGITFAPQGNRVFDELTVLENLEIGGFPLEKSKRQRRMEAVVELFPALRGRLRERAGRLSGGEQQMLALARALVPEPKLLLLDEPSLGLAPVLVRSALSRIREINKATGVSVLVVEQKVREVISIAHRVYGLRLGRTVLEAYPRDLEDGTALKELFL